MNVVLKISGLGPVLDVGSPPARGGSIAFAWVRGVPGARQLRPPVDEPSILEGVDAVLAAANDGQVTYLGPGAPLADDPLADALAAGCARAGLPFGVVGREPLWWRGRPESGAYAVLDRGSLESAEFTAPAFVCGLVGMQALREVVSRIDALAGPRDLTVLPWNEKPFKWPRDGVLETPPDSAFSVHVPAADPLEDHRSIRSLLEVAARLRAPDGCPWDREQTHESLRRHLIEEAYEAVEAIEGGNPVKLAEELGDVLSQIALHSQIGAEAGEFTFGDVVASITQKLIRRHPHVFGDAHAKTVDDVVRRWEEIKSDERGNGDRLESLPRSLPALLYAREVVSRGGLKRRGPGGEMKEFIAALEAALSRAKPEERERVLGRLLLRLVEVSAGLGLDPELALRRETRDSLGRGE